MNAKDIFAKRLARARELADMTQADLAEKTGMNPCQPSHFETGKRAPALENFRRIALALDVSADYLLGLSNSPERVGTSSIMGHLSVREKKLVTDIIGCIANGRDHANE